MDLSEFYKLHLDDRAQIVWLYGRYLASRKDGQFKIQLYYMGEFFAEVWHGPDENQLLQVRGFKASRCLDPYLDLVELRFD